MNYNNKDENDYLIWQPQAETDVICDEIAERPDLYLYENEENDINYNFDISKYEICQCCGANVVKYGRNPTICTVCGWEYDEKAYENPDMPSENNHNISLGEAKMNFTSFGTCYPKFY